MLDKHPAGVEMAASDDRIHTGAVSNNVELRSDNAAGVAPAILDAVADANHGSALAYGGDEATAALERLVQEIFEHDQARVFPVTSGTAANALGLASMTPPWGAVWCHETAHIIVNEGGATSALGGGVVMHGVGGDHGLIDRDALATSLASVRWGDNHQSQPSVLSLTQPNDFGNIYSVTEVHELCAVGADYGLRSHLDGARFANAVARLGCQPADLTWRAGVTTVSLGATKNGALSAEAVVTFDPDVATELTFRTKRAGHVTSKMRFQSAQLIAYLTDNYWLQLATNANARMADLLAGIDALDLGDRFKRRSPHRLDQAVNMAFFDVDADTATNLAAGGLDFYVMGSSIRFVTSWATTESDIERALEIIAQVSPS